MSVPVGTPLPRLAIPIDRLLILSGAIASQDFEDVHRDPDAARARGAQDIFMSINSTNGLIDRFVTEWAGPAARLRSVSLRLGVPLFPGDTLVLTGEVVDVDDDDTVTVRVSGTHERGTHVAATVRLTLSNGVTA